MPTQRLLTLVRRSPALMEVLSVAAETMPHPWCVGAGSVRNLVWDHLHGRPLSAPQTDVDVAYLDPLEGSARRETHYRSTLERRLPQYTWDVVNQSEAHRWYPEKFGVEIAQLTSLEQALSIWPETATAVGVCLAADGDLAVIAPYGLDDLFGMILRPSPSCPSAGAFEHRLVHKQFMRRWPALTVIRDPAVP